MAFDIKATAEGLRGRAKVLREEAIKLDQAAEVLDPAPSQKDLITLPPSNGATAIAPNNQVPLSELTIVDGAQIILQEAGKALSRDEIFGELKKRGSGVSSVVNLVSGLSRAKDKFVSIGNSRWELKSRLPDFLQ